MNTTEVKNTNELEIKFQTALGVADENTVDKWELMASRRALLNLKNLLHGEAMEKLIRKQMEESDAKIKEYLKLSNGEFKAVFVEAQVKGISATEYFAWQSEKMKNVRTGTAEQRHEVAKNVVYPAHPEHYLLLASGVTETLGGRPTGATVTKLPEMPKFVTELADPAFPNNSMSGIKIDDGTIWGYGLTEYRDTEDGCEMRFRVWWPAAVPQIFFDDHARHFAVEYRNFIHMAVAEIKAQKENEIK